MCYWVIGLVVEVGFFVLLLMLLFVFGFVVSVGFVGWYFG